MAKKRHIQSDIIDQLNEYQTPGEPDLILEVIDSFLTHMPPKIQLMEKHFTNQDLNKLADEAHALKSSSRTLGAIALSELCEILEGYRSNRDYNQISDSLEQLALEFSASCEELRKLRETRIQVQKKKIA